MHYLTNMIIAAPPERMGLSGMRRGAASPIVTYDFMDARTFRAGPCSEKRKEPGPAEDRFHGNSPFPLTDFALT